MIYPETLIRKAVIFYFNELGEKTWEYLFDHEKTNGLMKCRVSGKDSRHIWYSAEKIARWLVKHNIDL